MNLCKSVEEHEEIPFAKTADKDSCRTETVEAKGTVTSDHEVTNAQVDCSKPKHVSSKNWERFQALSKRADILTKRSTEKRIKHLQKTVKEKVHDCLHTEEERQVLAKHEVHLPTSKSSDRKKSEHSNATNERTPESAKWKEVQKYLGVNDHLLDAASASHQPPSGLQKHIDDMVAAGNIQAAEALSDQLAARDFGVKITEAFAAKDYLKRKKEEEESAKMKKRKKLQWGFDHKQRWETKGNM